MCTASASTRAMTLLRVSTHSSSPRAPIDSNYRLCIFSTEYVLSFCVDVTRVLVVDISEEHPDFSSRHAPTCLVVDDHGEAKHVSAATAWSPSCPPQHFIFAPMHYDRAHDWVRQWQRNDAMKLKGISVDMHDTYTDACGAFDSIPSLCLVEFTLPSTVSATCISDNFLSCCARLTHLDLSPFTNVRKIGRNFLRSGSALASLDLSPLTNVTEFGQYFLYCCSSLTSLDLSPLANVNEISGYFLEGCSRLTSLDLLPLTHVNEVGESFLYGCSALTSLDLSPLSNVSHIRPYFLFGCSGL
eukprot:PhM_4_TR3421/c0_g1_i3/m.425